MAAFALMIIVGIVTGLLSSIGSVVAVAYPTAGQIVSLVVSAPLGIAGYGIMADAYVQLRDSV